VPEPSTLTRAAAPGPEPGRGTPTPVAAPPLLALQRAQRHAGNAATGLLVQRSNADRRADPAQLNHTGLPARQQLCTPGQTAVLKGDLEALRLVLQHGAPTAVRDARGRRARNHPRTGPLQPMLFRGLTLTRLGELVAAVGPQNCVLMPDWKRQASGFQDIEIRWQPRLKVFLPGDYFTLEPPVRQAILRRPFTRVELRLARDAAERLAQENRPAAPRSP